MDSPERGFLIVLFLGTGVVSYYTSYLLFGQERGLIGYDGISDAGSSPAVPIGGAGTGYSHTGCTP